MKKKKWMVLLAVTLGLFYGGCASKPAGEGVGSEVEEENADTEVQEESAGIEDGSETGSESSAPEMENASEEIPRICRLTLADVAVMPEVVEYSFEEAGQSGTVHEMFGSLPGAAEGTWYTVELDGVEYYYGWYSFQEPEDTQLWNWSIISSEYVLANGLKTGMSESEAAEICPNMAVMDFEDNFVGERVGGTQGWNGITYPRRSDWQEGEGEYAGMDYSWTDQFDYAMIADIILPDEPDTLPLHLALLIKDHTVAAITFYYPTAG